jgi:hypothetical protein
LSNQIDPNPTQSESGQKKSIIDSFIFESCRVRLIRRIRSIIETIIVSQFYCHRIRNEVNKKMFFGVIGRSQRKPFTSFSQKNQDQQRRLIRTNVVSTPVYTISLSKLSLRLSADLAALFCWGPTCPCYTIRNSACGVRLP